MNDELLNIATTNIDKLLSEGLNNSDISYRLDFLSNVENQFHELEILISMVIVMNEKMMNPDTEAENFNNTGDSLAIIFQLGCIYERVNKKIDFIVKNN